MSSPTDLVSRVDFVSVPTRDIARAMAFYSDVLGLERSSVWQRGEAEPLGAEFETGNVTLALIVPERIGLEFRPSAVPIALRVADVAAARAELTARGVTFPADTLDSGVCHMAHFEDPDGNMLMLHHRYAPRAPEG